MLLLYDSYCLKKQIENLNLANLQLQNNLELVNSKCVEISTSINFLVDKQAVDTSSNVLVNLVPSLNVGGFYSLGAVLAVTLFFGSSGWFVGKFLYLSYLTNSSYIVSFKTFQYAVAYSSFTITTNKYSIFSNIIFTNQPIAGHSIKLVGHPNYIPLSNFLNKLMTVADPSTASLIISNTPIIL